MSISVSPSQMQLPVHLLDCDDDFPIDGNRLLANTDKEVDLIDLFSTDEAIKIKKEENLLDLSESPVAAMQLLDDTSTSPSNMVNNTPPPIRPPSVTMTVSTLDDLSQLDMGISYTPTVKAGSNYLAVPSRMSSSAPDPTSISSAVHNIKISALPKSTENTSSAQEKLAIATALATRKTEDVIADLKRPLHISPARPSKRHQSATSSSSFAELKEAIVKAGYVEQWIDEVTQNDEDDLEEEDDDEEDGIAPTSKPRKITERKRRQNAIADNHIQHALQKSIKKGNRVKPDEEALQSTKWLVNQSESHEIISTPRAYQNELFERAKEKNIIAVLDTGSGKTLIAVLLLRHIINQELEDRAIGRPKRISFFLVDSVTLVFQQHAVLKANLDQPMDMFCGEMGTDSYNREMWEKQFAKNMVIVCTAEILRQCLHHSFISMDRINLLIFDEAHHAKKDHSYARIVKDFYYQAAPGTSLPKIFGMTASPVDARIDVTKAAKQLEGLLHSEIATAADPTLGGLKVSSKQEYLAKYTPLVKMFETPLYKQMLEKFKSNAVFRKPLLFACESSRYLGSWCSDQVWPFCLSEDETKKLLAKTERQYYIKKVQEPLEILEQRKIQIQEAREIVLAHQFEQPHYDPITATSNNLSSKVALLIRYLRERYERPTDDKAIVFVKQRYTARLLARLFSYPNIGTPHLKVGTLVGTRSGDAGDLNVSFREQVVTMLNFRNGSINCLFATSVAEEGIDIPDCNLVIRFDLYTTLIQYIQSRGRARHANSRYIHMCEQWNQEHDQIIKEVRQNERILERFCQALPAQRLLSGGDFDMDHFLAKERSHRIYIEPETGAKLTYKVSLMVLANFVDSLPHNHDTQLTPEYIVTSQNKQFIGEVILPESSPIRGAMGRPASTKQVAKCSAAFETCILLRKGKYLDQWLVPVFTKQLPAMRNALLAVDSKKREAFNMRTKPNLWSVDTVPHELFLTLLILEKPECLDRASQPLALLTRSSLPELPSFPLHFGAGRSSNVRTIPISKSLKVDGSNLDQFNLFTLCIFDDVFSKGYESDVAKMPYFLVPIKSAQVSSSGPHDMIAWDILEQITEYQKKWGDKAWENRDWENAPDEFFKDKYVVDPYDGSRKLWTIGIAHQYKPLDPVPPNSAPRKGTRKNNDNIMEYSCSLWAKARARRTFDENQPVVEAQFISLRRNLLDEFDSTEMETSKECHVILEPLKISPLPTTVVAMAYLLPAIIHRVESYLIALDACALLHLNIRPDLALEALTKDSDNSEDHGNEQVNFQRGMGKNYERLEFLGDCFLKMATSISLYGIHPENDEYAYHVDRMMLICNKNLRNNAVNLKLFEYIRSCSFSRRAWYPEGLVLKKGKTAKAPDSHKLGDKTIADVCEALIGAALLSCHGTGNMDNAVRAVTEVVASENHNVTEYSQYYKLYKKPKYQTTQSTAAQRDLAEKVEKKHAYHFKYPRLLRSAFVHPSYPFSYEQIPSYQRLEFLGDSLLDMACINFLFHTFPERDPQWLTEHKMAMVSNQFLGALCVSLGFHTHLLLFNAGFQKQVTDYVTEITEARYQAEQDAIRAGKTKEECSPDYWATVRQPPKCLPDIIEAYVGAIFVDSEYNYSEVEKFFDQHIRWYFTDMSIYDTFANKHPTTFLTKFLQVNMGCMEWTVMAKEIPNIEGSKPQVMAMVIVHGQVISDYTSESSRYAKVGAAKRALELLKGLPLPEFRERYGCTCCIEGETSEGDEDAHATAI